LFALSLDRLTDVRLIIPACGVGYIQHLDCLGGVLVSVSQVPSRSRKIWGQDRLIGQSNAFIRALDSVPTAKNHPSCRLFKHIISVSNSKGCHMPQASAHPGDPHYITRSGWLRAAVLGANDGVVSVSSLIVGVAAAESNPSTVIIAGIAGLSAGAMSMAAGEYVSVSSQSDTEHADIARETKALQELPDEELAELAAIYREKGLSEETALVVAKELTEKDAVGTHIRDELGLSEAHPANPLQAAFTSGVTFSIAAAIPLLAAFAAPADSIIPVVLVVTVITLAALGALGAKAGAAPVLRATLRVVMWGVFAMAVTAGVGWLFGVSV
jgi:VIT1/CCC1 family predicted Fe2+/Mn2+ transporter